MGCHNLAVAAVALAMLASCGPGAADRAPIPSGEAEFDLHGVIWEKSEKVAAALPGDWECQGVCTGANLGETMPPAGETRGTFGAHGDADAGRISWTGIVPAGVSSVAVPVIVGPGGIPAIRLAVNFGPTYRLPQARTTWSWWRVHVKNGGGPRRITVTLIDTGKVAGEWVAMGAPHLVE